MKIHVMSKNILSQNEYSHIRFHCTNILCNSINKYVQIIDIIKCPVVTLVLRVCSEKLAVARKIFDKLSS